MASLLDRIGETYRNLGATTRDQTYDYLISQGVDPAIARSRADAVFSKINRNQGIAEFLTPQSMVDVGLMAATGPFGRPAARAITGGLLAASDINEAQAKVTGGVEKVKKVGSKIKQTVIDPIRNAFPGIYGNPKEIAAEAARRVAPEDPAMKQLFGVTRGDLYDISQEGRRAGNMEPSIATKDKARGSEAATRIMTPQNARRMVDTLGEAEKYPELIRGMDPWYVMDPAYQRLVQLVGPDEARNYYSRFNTFTGMASPGSEVLTEINRGTAANMMNTLGRFDDFARYGGMAGAKRGDDFPPELRNVIGHPYHSTSHALPMRNYIDKGYMDMQSPKVPLYIQSSGVPEIGFQTKLPVPDAHFTRAAGMADVRGSKDFGASMKMAEYQPFGPWYADNVARPLGIEAVPAQARMWGTFGHATGVDTAIGAGKLELLSKRIMDVAKKTGVNPQDLRDDVLLGRAHAGFALPLAGGAAASAFGGLSGLLDPEDKSVWGGT